MDETRQTRPRREKGRWLAPLELSKAPLIALVALTGVAGFLLARGGGVDARKLVWALLGLSLTAAGANAFNQALEVEADRRMRRTRERPLPSGRLGRRGALAWAAGALAAGIAILALRANWLTAALGLLAADLYLLVYTPLKARTPLSAQAGALVGAIPPMMGWAAVAGRVELGAWILGATLFVWQAPHFLALAWLRRGDYRRAGFRALPAVDRAGHATFDLILLYGLALIPAGLSAALAGLAGSVYGVGSLLLGALFAAASLRAYRRRTRRNVRRLFWAGLVYLPLLLGLMVADRPHSPAHARSATAAR
ncbi:MAG: heme o synthase [Candidatus Sumerlaeota bacterium]|nr:heme o synthase [Candidatus Sumerlaeota bacterium]